MDAVALYATKPFRSGRSQAIRIPKAYHLDDTEVIINKVGDSLVITPRSSLRKTFFEGISKISDDFLMDGRPEEVPNNRVEL